MKHAMTCQKKATKKIAKRSFIQLSPSNQVTPVKPEEMLMSPQPSISKMHISTTQASFSKDKKSASKRDQELHLYTMLSEDPTPKKQESLKSSPVKHEIIPSGTRTIESVKVIKCNSEGEPEGILSEEILNSKTPEQALVKEILKERPTHHITLFQEMIRDKIEKQKLETEIRLSQAVFSPSDKLVAIPNLTDLMIDDTNYPKTPPKAIDHISAVSVKSKTSTKEPD